MTTLVPDSRVSAFGAVAIPPDHFARRVANEYNDKHKALVREFLQNSIDAGARRVDFEFFSDSMTVRDDGRGIRPERMVEALLTLGGSVKESSDSIGGYGIAKEILLFAHRSYVIRTQDVVVSGEVLQYRIDPSNAHVKGAEFTIQFCNEFGYGRERMVAIAKEYFSTCQLAAEVYVNGELAACDCRGRKVDVSFAHGRVLSRRLPDGVTSNEIFVRVNGMTMFTYSVRDLDKQVIIELEGDVRRMLTSSRDSMRYPAANALNKVVQEITIDPKSFDRKKAERQVFPGREARCFTEALESLRLVLGSHLPGERVSTLVAAVKRAFENTEPVRPIVEAAVSELSSQGVSCDIENLIDLAKVEQAFKTDFIVSIEGTELKRVPRNLRPGTMSFRNMKLAKLWKSCLDAAIKASGLSIAFRIGFVLDPQKDACFGKGDDGIADILINPKVLENSKDMKDLFNAVMLAACHELAHALHHYHDEPFVIEMHRILRSTLNSGVTARKAFAAAAGVTL